MIFKQMCAIDNYLRFPSRSFGPGAKGGNAVCPDGAMCRLAARLQLPELAENAKCHIVVFCHGFTSSKEWPVFDMLADSLSMKESVYSALISTGMERATGNLRT